jgi:flagella basal body P-ring formation protein FlgA
MKSLIAPLLITLLATNVAVAAPVLRSEVVVTGEIVTVGDLFEGAGELAGQPLFRAPQPGTTGSVTLDAVKTAAGLVGLIDYAADGVARVRVSRAGNVIDETSFTALITDDLRNRGIVGQGVVVEAKFDTPDLAFNAAAVDQPVQLLSLRYTPANGVFIGSFQVAGQAAPVDLTGRVELMIEAPHLIASKAAGTVLGPSDIEMRLVPLRFAETAGVVDLEQLVGKALQRQSRAGLMLRAADVTEPEVVQRNSMVTVFLKHGGMTLTVKGQALTSAAAGKPVQVLNSVTKKILHGVATANGAVELSSTVNVAGL